jgi:glyoxylate/hydroxypyruvate reductase A
MKTLEFNVLGWSRSQKDMDGITCLSGEDGLTTLLNQSDHICAILPSTKETQHLMNAERFARMKPDSTLINCGRGSLINEADLMKALDAGRPGHAVLDVVSQEPLPADNPLWRHPGVTITPHVSGWHLGDAMKDIAANFLRLSAGEPLLHEVDRDRGY